MNFDEDLFSHRYASDFDDSDWPVAVEYGRNGDAVAPWNSFVDAISDDAKWIWTSDNYNDNVVFCRLSLGKLINVKS